MANIKISELDELQEAADQDLLVIVDVANNETKKIQAGNLGIGGAEIPIGSTPPKNPKDGDFWIDTSANGETYGDTLPIGAIVEYNGTTVPQGYEKVEDKVVTLYENVDGTTATFSTSENPNNYDYVDIISDLGTSRLYKYKDKLTISAVLYSDTVYYNSFRIIRTTSGFTIDNNKNWYGNNVIENTNKIYKVIGYKEV